MEDKNSTQANISTVTPSAQISSTSSSSNSLKTILLTLLAVIVLTGTLLAGILIGKNQIPSYPPTTAQLTVTPTTTSIITPIISPTTTVTPISITPTRILANTLTSIDNTWNLYTNNVHGYSIKIPKMATEYGGTCTNGKLSDSLVPVKNYDGFGTYITYEYFYEYPINNTCKKTITDLNIIDVRANQWKTGNGNPLMVPGNWHIITSKIENDSDLDYFIKTNYGTGCSLGAKSLSSTGVYDVKIQGDGLELDKTKCPINYVYALKYSPEFHKAATWAVGQSIVFSSADFKQSYDEEMINSFKFIN